MQDVIENTIPAVKDKSNIQVSNLMTDVRKIERKLRDEAVRLNQVHGIQVATGYELCIKHVLPDLHQAEKEIETLKAKLETLLK